MVSLNGVDDVVNVHCIGVSGGESGVHREDRDDADDSEVVR